MKYQLQNEWMQVEFDRVGATLSSVIEKESGLEYLWQGDPTYWSGQSPVLFPMCGSLRENKATTEDGKPIAMPRHGLVRKEEFVLEEQTETSICFSITSDENMFAQYPYAFKLFLNYTLVEKTITVTYQIQNLGEQTMPCAIGGHPGFNCPIDPKKSYDDYQLIMNQPEVANVPTPVTENGLIDVAHRTLFLNEETTVRLSHEMFHKDGVIFDELVSRSIVYTDQEKEHGVRLDFADFPYLILWSTQNDGPFIAIEPWSGLSTCSDEDDIFEHKRNMMFVEKDETKELTFSITII